MKSAKWGLVSASALAFYIRVIRAALRQHRRKPVDALHCGRTIPEGLIGLCVKWLKGVPYSCYVHGEDIEMCRSSRELTFLNRQVIRFADRLICNSENSARLLRESWDTPEDRIAILHPGVDTARFRPAQRPPPSCTGQKTILTVSRLVPRKGHDVMIKAMPLILEYHPDVQYVIIGSGRQQRALEALIEQENLQGSVRLLGELSDDEIIEWYQRSSLFVLPNRQIGNDVEGFGIVLLEAQACGLPVVGGDSGGTRETMRVGETGCIVDCTDPANVARVVVALLSNPTALARMGARGREHIEEAFSWPVIISRARNLFGCRGA